MEEKIRIIRVLFFKLMHYVHIPENQKEEFIGLLEQLKELTKGE